MNNNQFNQPPNQQQPPENAPQVDLTKTIEVTSASGGNVFNQGFLIRKASKYESGTPEDLMVPIPIFYDPKTFEVLEESIPPELRNASPQTIVPPNSQFNNQNDSWNLDENKEQNPQNLESPPNNNEFNWDNSEIEDEDFTEW